MQVKRRIVESLDEVNIDFEAFLYHDVETEQLGRKIRLVQLYQSAWEEALIIDIHKFDLIDVYMLVKDAHHVWANGLYERTCYRRDLGTFATFERFYDTFLAGRLALPHLPKFSLDYMLAAVHKVDVYEAQGLDKKKLQKSNWSAKVLTEQQLDYAASDVYFLPKLWAYCIDKQEEFSYKLDVLTTNYMLIYQDTGMPVDKELLDMAYETTYSDIARYKALLPKGFNSRSYQQVRAYLKSSESDDLALAGMEAQGDERAGWLRQLRKNLKRLNFIEKFTSENGRVYGHFNVATRSGRSNCSDQNLQQIPGALKHVFQSKKFLVYADFSNLELRTFAAIVNEPVMVKKFFEDADLHIYSASKLFGVPEKEVTKRQRTIAKIWNFSSLYGAGVNTRINILLKLTGILITKAEGKKLAEAWLRTYPGVKPWQTENANKWRAGQPGYTALGRPYIAKLFTDQNNIQVQGSGAEVAKLTQHYLNEKIDISKMIVFVHDSYTFELDTLEEAQAYAKVLAESMNEAWREVSKNFKVKNLPMPVDAVIAHNWYDCQEDKNLLYKYSITNDGSILEQTVFEDTVKEPEDEIEEDLDYEEESVL